MQKNFQLAATYEKGLKSASFVFRSFAIGFKIES